MIQIEDILLFLAFLVLVTILAIPLGNYMAKVFSGKKTFLTPIMRPIEKLIYRIGSIDENQEMGWKKYAFVLIIFNVIGFFFLWILQMVQGNLPLNPDGLPNVSWDLAFNTAVSFMTNTNWQAYGGETTMSYLTQMLGLTLQNFLSPAVGIASLIALIRGFARKNCKTIGNFWVDLTRSLLYVMIPIAVIFALIFMAQGTVQTLGGAIHAQTLEGVEQIIAVGPAASQIAIKMIGSNGGGFFNINSAHPFENPSGLNSLFHTLAILLIPAGLVFTFGRMIRNFKTGLAIYMAMMILMVGGLGIAYTAENQLNPLVADMGVEGQNLEGKELRLETSKSTLFGTATTSVSNGAVNSMHESTMPLTSLVYLFNMGIGEVIFGGLGVGLNGMILYVIITMFIAGLMIGRTPEFLGKKFGPYEMKVALVGLLVPSASLLVLAGIAMALPSTLESLNNIGSRGVLEILYAYHSAIGNNGSAFAGLNSDTVFFNLTLGLGMLIGRFATILPVLAIAGALAKKGKVPETSATFPSTNVLFILLLVAVVIIIGALTFFPVYTLGGILEHLMLYGA